MDFREIILKIDNALVKADLSYTTDPPCIHLKIKNSDFISTGDDLYTCLAKLREQMPDIDFLCKGSKINVHPSRSTRQMTAGLMAYELKMGEQARRSDLVNIFDFDDDNLTNNPSKQNIFFKEWIASLR